MNSPDEKRTKNALEWTVFAISLILVIGTIGLLVNAALKTKPSPPRLRVESGQSETVNGRITIPIRVINDGGQVAENVDVSVTLGEGPDQQEAGFTIDFIPHQGTRKGAVSFQATGGPIEPKIAILGYSTP